MSDAFDLYAEELSQIDSRKLVGVGLAQAQKGDPGIIVLYADVGRRFGLQAFEGQGGRTMEMGIAEQNMVGVAAGLSHEGQVTAIITYGPFLAGRTFDQIKANVGDMQLPLILIGSPSGLSAGGLGALSTCTDDVAMLRTIPGLTIVSPADGVEAIKCFVAAVQAHTPVYIRMTGKTLPAVYHQDYTFVLGKAIPLREGKRVLVITNGAVTANVLAAADRLAAENNPVAVFNMHTIKPLDTAALEPYLDFEAIVTVEEHSIFGGLGEAVASYLAERTHHPALVKLGVPDCYFVADHYENLLDEAGLSTEKIYQILKDLLACPTQRQ